MGAITIEKSNSLFWLGRYIERVFITTRYYSQLFDVMLDKNSEVYHDYCKKLDINDFYYNDAHFMMSYLYDSDNIDSIYSNLRRAYDNAVVLRDEISSEVLSYIQMGMNTFAKMEETEAPIMLLQDIIDDIYAFWGSLGDDADACSKDIIKLGKLAERVDMYCRLDYSSSMIDKSYHKLLYCIKRLSEETDITGLEEYDTNILPDTFIMMKNIVNLTGLFEVG
ncbi:MAG: alpha-E domain-containing protein [Bacilli bacterium]|nr:alpha-E domain-containing protein [Bacilli bacterium]